MNVYISCHHPDPANELAAILTAAGYGVVSTWHSSGEQRPDLADADAWHAKAEANFRQIEAADALVLIAGPDKYTGGKFVEAGFAMGRLMPVYCLGRVENGMLHHAGDVVLDAVALLAELAYDFGSTETSRP